MADIKTPFKDALETKVPTTSTGSGKSGVQEVPGVPGRDGSGVAPEVTRDSIASGPKTSGPVKTPFKDAVG